MYHSRGGTAPHPPVHQFFASAGCTASSAFSPDALIAQHCTPEAARTVGTLAAGSQALGRIADVTAQGKACLSLRLVPSADLATLAQDPARLMCSNTAALIQACSCCRMQAGFVYLLRITGLAGWPCLSPALLPWVRPHSRLRSCIYVQKQT